MKDMQVLACYLQAFRMARGSLGELNRKTRRRVDLHIILLVDPHCDAKIREVLMSYSVYCLHCATTH